MRVAQIGNFVPPYSTENDLNRAMESLDWEVLKVQEGDRPALEELLIRLPNSDFDFVLWTSTRDLANKWGHELQWKLLATAGRHNVPTVGYHLDRWMGLRRQHGAVSEPYFHVDLLVTADGAHQDEWKEIGVNHRWMPPGVSEQWCVPGEYKDELATRIVFTGSWQHYGHSEWKHRGELVAWLQKNYGDDVAFYPKQGQHAVRGLELNDIYWSANVVVGDSCLAPRVDGSPMFNYCSDRVPETLGRGGVLIHPIVDGIHDGVGETAYGWDLGDWNMLKEWIDIVVDLDTNDHRLRSIKEIRANHTYEVRMKELGELLIEEKLL